MRFFLRSVNGLLCKSLFVATFIKILLGILISLRFVFCEPRIHKDNINILL